MYDNFCRYYDSLTGDVEYSKRADRFYGILCANGCDGGILLDLGCGTGSMCVEMSVKGYDVIGVDSSVGMLMAAREKAAEKGLDILLLNQSMEELDLYGTVDCAVSVLDSINHLPSAEAVLRAFEKVSLFMVPGGIFIFDVNTVYKHRNILADNTFVLENDSLFCVWQNELNEDDSVSINLDFFEEEDGAYYRSSESFTERAYSIEKLTEMLDKAGFDILAINDDISENPLSERSERAMFTAKKR